MLKKKQFNGKCFKNFRGYLYMYEFKEDYGIPADLPLWCHGQKMRKVAPGKVLMSLCHLNSHSLVTRLPFNEFFSLVVITPSADSHPFSPSQNSSLPSPVWSKTHARANLTFSKIHKKLPAKIAKPKKTMTSILSFLNHQTPILNKHLNKSNLK